MWNSRFGFDHSFNAINKTACGFDGNNTEQ